MSLLNQVYATPSRVKGVLQLLAGERGHKLKRESAEQLLSPDSLLREDEDGTGTNRAMVQGTIEECVRLRLIITDGDLLLLNPDLPDSARRYETIAAVLPRIILERALDTASDANEDLGLALAWFLGQDALDAPGTWQECGEAMVKQAVTEVLRFNDNRYKQFTYWSRYLGMANFLGTPLTATSWEERLTPDPTGFLRNVVGALLGREKERVPITEFLRRLSTACPLFEGGAVRSTMDAYMSAREPRYLSSTTSHALLRLEEEGTIRLEMLSDADAILLVDGARPRAVSELLLMSAPRAVA